MTGPLVVGVLGGTFDPIHLGHLEIATWLHGALRLPRMLLMPTAVPPHKSASDLASAYHRAAMVRLAVADHPQLELSNLELSTDRVCFTIDSLRTLRDADPPCKPAFVMGVDALVDLPTWKDYAHLVREFDLIVVDRPDRKLDSVRSLLHPDVAQRIASYPRLERVAQELARVDRRGRILPVRRRTIPISSSGIRERVSAGLPLDDLVPPRVAGYIQCNSLYRQEDER